LAAVDCTQRVQASLSPFEDEKISSPGENFAPQKLHSCPSKEHAAQS